MQLTTWLSSLKSGLARRQLRRRNTPLNRSAAFIERATELLEDRTLLSGLSVTRDRIAELWQDKIASGSAFANVIDQALSSHNRSFFNAAGGTSGTDLVIQAISQLDPTISQTTVGSLTVTAALEVGGEFNFGVPNLANVELVGLATGYNVSMKLIEDGGSVVPESYTLSRVYSLDMPIAALTAEFYASFTTLDSPTHITIGARIIASPGKPEFKIGKNLWGIDLEVQGNVAQTTIQAETTMPIATFLSSQFTDQPNLSEGLKDVFIPYYGDGWGQRILTRATSFGGLPLGMITDAAFYPDTPLGILAKRLNVIDISVSNTASIQASAFLKLQTPDFVVAPGLSANLGLRAGVSVAGALETSLHLETGQTWNPNEIDLRGATLEQTASYLEDVLPAIDGVTVITHGYQPPVLGGGDSLRDLADAIYARQDSILLDYSVDGPGGSGTFEIERVPHTPQSTELVFLYDWSRESRESTTGFAEAAADSLFSYLVGLGLVDPATGTSPKLHFIGHSFGAAVTSEVVERLARFDVDVDHVTYLDPHDFDQPNGNGELGVPVDEDTDMWLLGRPTEYGVTVWDNIGFTDVYYQTSGAGFTPEGRPIPGAYNVWLRPEDVSGGFSVSDHTNVWYKFYLDSIRSQTPYDTSSEDPLDFSGYRFSRLANPNSTPARPQVTESGQPFYEPQHAFISTAFPNAQNHKWSPTAYIAGDLADAPRPSAAVNAGQIAELNTAEYSSNWDQLGVFNGDFSLGNDRVSDARLYPGWSQHGGEFERLATTGQAMIALSDQQGPSEISHNYFYIPPTATKLEFKFQRLLIASPSLDATARFEVLLNGEIMRFIHMNTADGSLQTLSFDLTQNFRNKAAKLTFQITGNSAALQADPRVIIDDVRLLGTATVDPGKPDLSVRLSGAVTGSALNSNPGPGADRSLNVPITISNVGDAVSATYELEYWLSSDTVLDGADNLLLSAPSATGLGIQETRYPLQGVSVSASIPGGQYFLIVDAALASGTELSGGAPNRAVSDRLTINQIPAGFVELDISNFQVPATAAHGGIVSLSATFENTGNTATGGFRTRVWLTSDRDRTYNAGSDTLLTASPVAQPSLETTGEATVWQPTFTLPGSLAVGDYFVVLEVSDLSANVMDVVVTTSSLQVQADAEPSTIGFQFPNGPARSGAVVTQPFNGNFASGGHLATDFRGREGTAVFAVADGEVTFSDFGGRSWGHVVIIKHATTTWNWDKDVFSMYGHVNPSVVKGQIVTRGQQVATVGPQAEGSDAPHLHFEIRSGADAGHAPGPGYHSGNGVAAGSGIRLSNYNKDITWFDPVAIITPNLFSDVPAVDRIDLVPEYVNAPPTASPGDTIPVFLRIANQGTSASGSFDAQFVISRDRYVTPRDTFLGSPVTISSISGGDLHRLTTNVTLPSDLESGRSYWVGVLLDPDNAITEYNNSNNDLGDSTAIGIVETGGGGGGAGGGDKPDLVGASMSLQSGEATWGDRISFKYQVKNVGKAAANSSSVRFEFASSPVNPTWTQLITTKPVAALPVGLSASGTVVDTLPLRAPADFPGGRLYVRMVVDPADVVDEEHEDNNSGKRETADWLKLPSPYGSGPAPDLVGEQLVVQFAQSTFEWGDRIPVEYTFRNTGGNATAFNWQFVLSRNEGFSSEDYLLAARGLHHLDGGDTYTDSLRLRLPSEAPAGFSSGPLFIGVLLDPSNNLSERTRSNNQGLGLGTDYVAVTIVPPPPTSAGPNPEIGSLTVTPSAVVRGEKVHLTANNVLDDFNAVNDVKFWIDANGDSQVDVGDHFLGHGSRLGITATASFRTDANWLNGDVSILARATDNHGLHSDIAVATINVTGNQPGPFPDDSYENNDSLADAYYLGGAGLYQLNGLAMAANDDDYFSFTVAGTNANIDVSINFFEETDAGNGQPIGDLALSLMDYRGSSVGWSDTSSAGNTSESISVSRSSGRYFVRVLGQTITGGGGQRDQNPTYSLTLNITPEAGDPVAGPITLSHPEIVRGEELTLSMTGITAIAVQDIDGVHFSADFNYDGDIQYDSDYLATDWGNTGDGPGGIHQVTVDTSSWPLGELTIFGVVSHENGLSGLAEDATVTVLENHAPVMDQLSVPASLIQGVDLTLTAKSVDDSDPNAVVSSVRFYRDENANDVLDSDDADLGVGAKQANNDWTMTVPTANWGLGVNRVFAIATDNLGLAAPSVSADVQLLPTSNEVPIVESLVGPADVFRKSPLTLVAVGVTEPNGDDLTVTFHRDSNENGFYDASDVVVGSVSQVGNDYTATIATDDYAEGSHRFFVRVLDDGVPPFSVERGIDVFVVDTAGPVVVSQTPTQPVEGSRSVVTVTFDEAVNPDTFTTADITSFTGPSGSIAVSNVQPVSGTGNQEFEITFPRQTKSGSYVMTIAPGVSDIVGNVMDQDEDGSGGEPTDDRYQLAFSITSPPADFDWAFAVGAEERDEANSIAVDDAGNTYVTGYFMRTVNFNPLGSAVNRSAQGVDTADRDVFVAKYAPNGSLVWVQTFLGSNNDRGEGIAVDGSGNVYVVGYFSSDLTIGSTTLNGADSDVFVAKLNSSGTPLWAKQTTGGGADWAHGIAVDSSGNVFVAGRFQNTATIAGTSLTSAGDWDLFIAKWSTSGGNLWAKRFGSTGADYGRKIAVGPDGHPVAVGRYQDTVNFGGSTLSGSFGFALKLNGATGSTQWVADMRLPTTGVAIDEENDVTVVGRFAGSEDFDPGAGTHTLTSRGGNDLFVVQLDSGGQLNWATQIGGTASEGSSDTRVTTDALGGVYVLGDFSGTVDFDESAAVHQVTSQGNRDIFVSALSPEGDFKWVRSIGGADYENAFGGVGVDGQGNVVISGVFDSPIQPDAGGVASFTLNSNNEYLDFFVAKLVDLSPRTFTVTNTNDSGAGSLRQAIIDSNASPSEDAIEFDIAGSGPHSIALSSTLPTITDVVVIDATTEPDYAGTPVVELNGASAGNVSGLTISADNSIVRGLAINRFAYYGIVIDGADNSVIESNFIGTNTAGTAVQSNGRTGVYVINGSSSNRIGTNGDGSNDAGERNVISGNNFDGVVLEGAGVDDNIVSGNFIGTDVTGQNELGGNHFGVKISGGAKRNRVGTNGDGIADAAERNVISGNVWDGVFIGDVGTDLNVVAGNYIGVDAAGTGALGNNYGVRIDNGAKINVIGTDGDGVADNAERNVISSSANDGVLITATGTEGNVIAGNYIGLNATGQVALGNTWSGVAISGGADNNIVGTNSDGQGDAAERNVISANLIDGVAVFGTGTAGNVIAGNFIGTNATGTGDLGNAANGVQIHSGAAGNFVGGTNSVQRNVLSGNESAGLRIDGANQNTVRGNYVGTDVTGTQDVGNAVYGILLAGGATQNVIGGNGAGARNIVSGNDSLGIYVFASDANSIQGNWVGLKPNGDAFPSHQWGIGLASGSDNNLVGGTVPGAGNVVAHTTNAGITVWDGSGNALLGNALFGHANRGIDLGNDGATANDAGDSDSGANNLQNHPVLQRALQVTGGTRITGSLASEPSKTYRIEFLKSAANGLSGQYLGSVNVTTNASGDATFDHVLTQTLGSGALIQATATDPNNNTSELSAAVTAEAPNLTLTSAYLIDGTGARITSPVLGETVAVRANYNSTDLPNDAEYQVHFTVDGVLLHSGTISAGAGVTSGAWTWWRNGWFATSGAHSVTVTVDGLNTVSETVEADNSNTFQFTPSNVATLPAKFILPLGGNPNVDWSVVNYVDVDPTGGAADFRGGLYQYNGHAGIDITLPNFAAMDAGVPVYAAANGTVLSVADGNFDREITSATRDANFVTVDHGNGWVSEYVHLLSNSITVSAGDQVSAGDVLGLVGSSGNSTDAHLHFAVRRHGFVVETMLAPSQYWVTPLPYQRETAPAVTDAGITDRAPWDDFRELPSPVHWFSTADDSDVWAWFRISHLRDTDDVVVRWLRPNGDLETSSPYDPTSDIRYGSFAWFLDETRWQQHTGNWQVVLLVDDVEVARDSFYVSATGVPDVYVTTSSTTLIDGRTTPLDLGTVALAGTPPETIVTIANRGTAALTLGGFQLPDGVSFVGILPSAIAVGQQEDITLQLSTDLAGATFGQLVFGTNDPDVGQFHVNVSGQVTGSRAAGTPTVTLSDGALAVDSQAAHVMDASAVFADSDTSSFSGGQLSVTIVSGSSVGDMLGVRNEGFGAGQIAVDGTFIRYSGNVIGDLTLAGDSLSVDLNGNAAVAAVQALIRNVTFENATLTPSSVPRYLGVHVDDGTGKASQAAIKTVLVAPRGGNRVPVVGTISRRTVIEDAGVVPFTFTVGDDATAADDLVFVKSTSNPALVPEANLAITGSGANRTLTVTPADHQFGVAEITLGVRDENGGYASQRFVVTVISENDAPTDIALSSNTVSEYADTASGDVLIGELSATDADGTDTLSFSLVAGAGGSDNASFVIVGDELRLKQGTSLHFETQSSYAVRVQVHDGTVGFEYQFVITVINENTVSTGITVSPAAVSESANTSAGPVDIGSLTASDDDELDSHAFTLVAGSGDGDNNLFVIDAGKLRLKQDTPLDHETTDTLFVRLRVDDGTATFEEALTVSVLDGNEPSTGLTLSPVSIAENTDTSGGTVTVGTLTTDDPDVGNTFTYSLVDGSGDADNASFVIAGDAMQVKQNLVLDHEAQDEYFVRVRVNDGANTFEKEFVVTVGDENETPTNMTLSSSNIAENTDASGGPVTVGTLATVDPDQGNTFTYSLVVGSGDADNGSFVIAGDALKVKQNTVLDHEAQDEYFVRVRVNDGANTFEKEFVVTVGDENETPTNMTLSSSNIAENADTSGGPVTVGTLATVDPDQGNTFAYSLVVGSGDADNVSFVIAGGALQVKQDTVLDHEAQDEYFVRVRVNDGANTFVKTFVVTVGDANESPTDMTLSSSSLVENTDTSGGAVTVGTLATVDPDQGNTFTYSLVVGIGDADNASFVIASDVLQVKQDTLLNHETQDEYRVRVSVNDGAQTFEKTFVVTVGDENETPTDMTLSSSSIVENTDTSGGPVTVGTLATVDPDVGNTFTYSLVVGSGDADNASFAIAGDALQVKQDTVLDHETQDEYVVRLRVSDGANTFEKAFVVTVGDVNEPPSAIRLSNPVISIYADVDTSQPIVIAGVQVIDDALGSVTLTIAGSDSQLFEVSNGQLVLKAGAVLDSHTNPSLDVVLQADDPDVGATPDVSINVSVDVLPAAGFSISEIGGDSAVTEGGAGDSITIKLDSPPTSPVVLELQPDIAGQVTIEPSRLTFTPDNWNTARTVNLTAVNDDRVERDQTVTVSVSVVGSESDDRFENLAPKSFDVTVHSDDVAGFVLSQTSVSIRENGAAASFTARLTGQPASSVVITAAGSDATEFVVAPASLTFTPDNWDVPQQFSVAPEDDLIVDGSQVGSVVLSVSADQSDDLFDAVESQTVEVTVADDDTARPPGITVTETGGTTVVDEAGGTDQFTVVLDAAPTTDVVIMLSNSDSGEVRLSAETLTFTATDWSTPQTVTVTGLADDEIADGDVKVTVTLSVDAAVSDIGYASATPVDVMAVNLSHVSHQSFTLESLGRVTDYVDVVSLTGNDDLDVEVRTSDGELMSPGTGRRVSFAGYPVGTYEIWVNDLANNVRFDPNDGFGESTLPSVIRAIDVDGNGSFQFANDGIIFLAFALGSRGSQLESFRDQQSSRDGRQLETIIGQLADALDVDGDGEFRFANDGIILLAHTLGIRGDRLEPFRGPNATRTGEQIEGRIDGLLAQANANARIESPAATVSGEAQMLATSIVNLTPPGGLVVELESQVTLNAVHPFTPWPNNSNQPMEVPAPENRAASGSDAVEQEGHWESFSPIDAFYSSGQELADLLLPSAIQPV